MKKTVYLFGHALDALYEMAVVDEESVTTATVRYADTGEWTKKGEVAVRVNLTADCKVSIELPLSRTSDLSSIDLCDAYPLAEALSAVAGRPNLYLKKMRIKR